MRSGKFGSKSGFRALICLQEPAHQVLVLVPAINMGKHFIGPNIQRLKVTRAAGQSKGLRNTLLGVASRGCSYPSRWLKTTQKVGDRAMLPMACRACSFCDSEVASFSSILYSCALGVHTGLSGLHEADQTSPGSLRESSRDA